MKLILFVVVYYILFFMVEILDIFGGIRLWSQQERTSNCYDWFNHYLKKDYGIVNGKSVYDYSENIFLNDYTIKGEESLNNKYNLIFNDLNLSKGKTLLDCGCGVGTWLSFCKERGVNVIGLTLSKEQQKVNKKKGLTVYVQDYRVLDKRFINKFDAISLLGSAEHITISSGYFNNEKKAYKNYNNLFKVLKQYLKPNGKILMTVLIKCNTESIISKPYGALQCYLLDRHYGGYYSTPKNISNAITNNGFTIDSINDHTKDYHWISVVEPDHFGHWWIRWKENILDKINYIFIGLLTDPFLLHHWLYYGMDTWMWQLGGYQKTPLTDEQVNGSIANLKYFSISN